MERYEPAMSFDEDAAVAFLKDAARGGPALELAIGTGRVALPLADEGIAVDGIDLAPAMVARLREKQGDAGIGVTMGHIADVPVDAATASSTSSTTRCSTCSTRTTGSRSTPPAGCTSRYGVAEELHGGLRGDGLCGEPASPPQIEVVRGGGGNLGCSCRLCTTPRGDAETDRSSELGHRLAIAIGKCGQRSVG